MQTGLVQERQEFILPADAYPQLENAFVWRERIKRKQGYQLLGRLRRVLTSLSLGNTILNNLTYTYPNIFAAFVPPIAATETNKEIQPGSLVVTIAAPDAATFTDNGAGGFTVTGKGSVIGSSINYATGAVVLRVTSAVGGAAITASINYYPNLPVMGLRSRERTNINNEQTVAFDQIYAYRFVGSLPTGGWQEFIPGTTWTGTNSDFFWSTNYFVGDGNQKIFWVTNFSGTAGDPIRYTNGNAWEDFAPTINAAGDVLAQCLAMLPFRGRLVTFNTLEGADLATSVSYTNRVRWAAIGTPFSDVSGIVTTVNPNAWRDDIRGQGGFLDIPTSEAIVSVGFVRDNLVIYCERSTWQLRYTGRSIAPFQIEKVNSELGAESTFSAVQFDTSLVGVGDKGIVECDSFKSDRIDIKIPDLIYEFNNNNEGTKRVHGIRDFQQRLAFWIYPYAPTTSLNESADAVYPDRRLVYNYENDSWAIFTDSLTCLGNYQSQTSRRWNDKPSTAWQNANYPWLQRPALFPSIIGGNQQGFVLYLDEQVSSQVSLTINAITFNTTTPTVITSYSHNLQTGQVIQVNDIPAATGFASLNLQKFGIVRLDADSFELWKYDPTTGEFTIPQLDASGAYIGGGQIAVRDGFSIVSKKFNFLDQGQAVQIGYLDILMDTTSNGAMTLNTYIDYDDNTTTNTLPNNEVESTGLADPFFNSIINTTASAFNVQGASKNWQRVICPTRGQFITLEFTLSNAQLVGDEQESNVQIDAQILWQRPGGRLSIGA